MRFKLYVHWNNVYANTILFIIHQENNKDKAYSHFIKRKRNAEIKMKCCVCDIR